MCNECMINELESLVSEYSKLRVVSVCVEVNGRCFYTIYIHSVKVTKLYCWLKVVSFVIDTNKFKKELLKCYLQI